MWLRAARANRKLKRNARTKDADGIQASSLLYETQLEAISQHKYILWEEGGGGTHSPRPATLPLRLRPRDMQHFKTNTV